MATGSDTRNQPFGDSEAILATVARLFAAEGDTTAVDLLAVAQPRFEWYSHDNWDGGFDIYNLYLDVPLSFYSRVEGHRADLEQAILDRTQSVLQGRSVDHIAQVTIVVEVMGSGNWREGAQAWVAGKNPAHATSNVQSSIRPEVFTLADSPNFQDQVAVMMPFAAEFNATYGAIQAACSDVGLVAVRADDIWENSTFIQDIVDLIQCSRVTIVDFSGRNPNVMYETGIAHTLGRHVVPITRTLSDVPSNLKHHRTLEYLPNSEGLSSLTRSLALRLSTITGRKQKE